MSLQTWLATRADRCPGCGFHVKTQGCACAGNRLKFKGQAVATAAHPTDRELVDAAIRTMAAAGRPFSANECRAIHGVKGGVVGAAFTAAHKAGLIVPAPGDGLVRSTSAETHGHHIFKWVGAQAVAA